MHASSVQRAADAADSVPRTTAATTHRQQTCNGALRARGGVQQTGNAQRSASHRGQDGALASRVAPCVYVLGRRGGGGRHHAWLTAQQRRSSRNARWRSIRCNRRGCSTERHGTARHGTARHGMAASQERRRQRHASECVGGRHTQAIRSIRTGITWKVESATTAQGRSGSSAVMPHPAHSAGTPAAGAACSSTARVNAAVDASTSPSACTGAVDAAAHSCSCDTA